MKNVTQTSLLKLLNGVKQFILPIYQRRYSWKTQDCQDLWDDIVRIGENKDLPSHFFGSIVYREEETDSVEQFFVIDGQQRLATCLLLLSALGGAIEANGAEIGIDRGRINDYYLSNPLERGDFRHKLLLTKHDRDTLIQLLGDGEVYDNNSLLVKNYNFFRKNLESGNLETVHEGIRKLIIVAIPLSDADDPQLIFESLNSKGVRLSESDLIRNYVLMGQELHFQNRLYDIHWSPMEESFGAEHSKRFDDFMRDYLILKTGQVPSKSKVYESFKKNYMPYSRQPERSEEKVREIVRYSQHYVRISLISEDQDPELYACLFDINDLKAEASYPILLGVYNRYIQGQIEKASVIEILRLIESYTVRRLVCELATKSVHTNFASIAKKFESGSSLQEMKDDFSQLSHPDQFPSNQEFKEAFLKKDVYTSRALRNYLLRKLENHERREAIDVQTYTIERVMPENLTEQWEVDLGENWEDTHQIYLNTIGNLTLTGYNSELSNRPFIEKRDMPGGFRDSPLRLNKSLAQVDRWDEDAIKNRAEILSEKALKIWKDHGIDQLIPPDTGEPKPVPPTRLAVTMPNGTTIADETAASTFVKVIDKLKRRDVKRLNLKVNGRDLMSTSEDDQQRLKLGGYWVHVDSSTDRKKRLLEHIASRLDVTLEVKTIPK